jgi:hypothetical protein
MTNVVVGLTALLVSWTVFPLQPAADATRPLVNAYLDVQSHLAADRFEEAKAPARSLASQAKAMGQPGQDIAKAAAAFEAAADIKAAREAFGRLSDAVIARLTADGLKDAADLRLAYCPMAKRSWLQRDAQIRNPYYGSQMSTCGEFKPLKK